MAGEKRLNEILQRLGVTLSQCRMHKEDGMDIYTLPSRELYVDSDRHLRRCVIGEINPVQPEITVLIVGATGNGKTTLIDGICNYFLGTKWEDNWRVRLVGDHEEERANKQQGQVQSQTEHVNIYTIASRDISYTLNVIDTPGFGAVQGESRDQDTVQQINFLFENPRKYGIDSLRAVCFVTKASDARLTATQRYIFDSVLKLFGNNIKDNILATITFVDGRKVPVKEALKEAGVPYRQDKVLLFNNAALFVNNGNRVKYSSSESSDDSEGENTLDKLNWNRAMKSYKSFFEILVNLEPKSLEMTAEVLDSRFYFQAILQALERKIEKGLGLMVELNKIRDEIKRNEGKIKENKEVFIRVMEYKEVRKQCGWLHYVTYCTKCKEMCHNGCWLPSAFSRKTCKVMVKQHCTVCPGKCHYEHHTNSDFYVENVGYEVVKTLNDIEQSHRESLDRGKSLEESLKENYGSCEQEVKTLVLECHSTLQKLNQLALKPEPTSATEYIDKVIDKVRKEGKPGYENIIKELERIKESFSSTRYMELLHLNL